MATTIYDGVAGAERGGPGEQRQILAGVSWWKRPWPAPWRLSSRVRWSGFGRSRFVRLFAFLGPRQSRDSCRSRGLALLRDSCRSRHKPTWSRPPANLPLSLGVVGRSRRVAETPGCQFIGFPGLPSPSSRQSQCTHLRIPRPPLVGGAVPRCPRSPVQTSAPVPVPVPVFALGSG